MRDKVSIRNYAAKYCPLLVLHDHTKRKILALKPLGSSVLIKISDTYLLLTAAHVLLDYMKTPIAPYNEKEKEVGFIIKNIFHGIGAAIRYFEPDTGEDEENKKDIAFYHLCEETVEALREIHDFLDFEKIEFGHYSEMGSNYGVYGYPSGDDSIRKSYPNKTVTVEPLSLLTYGVPPVYYDDNEIDYNKKLILIAGDQEIAGMTYKFSGEPLPKLGGISGCGVWHILNLQDSEPEFNLVGIMTGYGYIELDNVKKSKRVTLLYATKIDALVDYMIAEKILSASNSK